MKTKELIKKTDYFKKILTEKNLCKLIEIRLRNQGCEEAIEKIEFEEWHNMGFSCIVYYKNWAPERNGMTFNKFYPNELAYLITNGATFETKYGKLILK